jgi:4-amino-4-deoxy-L-arabinose transferase-like glycosyltransferase
MSKKRKEKESAAPPAATAELRVPDGLAAAIVLAAVGLSLKLNNGFLQNRWPQIKTNLSFAVPPLWRMTEAALAANLTAAAEALWLCAGLCGAGSFLIESLGVEPDDAWERWALSFGLGLGAWGTALLLLGLAGLLYPALLVALTVPSALLLLKRRRPPLETTAATEPLSALGKICGAFFVLLLLISLPNALAPETFYDALMYHLALPDLYLLRHRVFATPFNLYAGIPSLPQMTFAAALAWDRWGVVAKLVHFAIFPALAAAFMAAARRWKRPDAGPLAACLFFGAPVAFTEAGRVTVGAELGMFQFLSFYCFAAACGLDAPARRRWFVLSGLFLGFAFSTKYTAWVLPAAFLLAWAVSAWRRAAMPPRAKELAAIFLVAAAVTSPWIVRNAVFYRSPLYPYLAGTFHAENAEYIQMERLKTESKGQDPVRVLTEPSRLASYLRLPWDQSLRFGKDDLDYPGPAFLMLLPALLLVPLSEPLLLLSVLALGAFYGLGLFTVLPRYFIPCFAVLAPPLAWAACGLRPRWLKACAAAAVLGTGVINVIPLVRSNIWPVFLGLQSRDRFLAHGTDNGYVTPAYAGFRYLNERAPADAKVLLVGDGRSFYLKRDSLGATVFNSGPWEVWANASADAGALRKKFSDAGVSYVLVNRGEAVRNKRAFAFTERGRAVSDEFWKKYLLKEFEVGSSGDRWVVVYRLLNDEEAARPHPAYDPFRAPNFTAATLPPAGDD